MSTRGDIVAVTCLALEARIALGPGVSVICTHASQLIAALDQGDAVVCMAGPHDAQLVTFHPRGFHRIIRAKFGLDN